MQPHRGMSTGPRVTTEPLLDEWQALCDGAVEVHCYAVQLVPQPLPDAFEIPLVSLPLGRGSRQQGIAKCCWGEPETTLCRTTVLCTAPASQWNILDALPRPGVLGANLSAV